MQVLIQPPNGSSFTDISLLVLAKTFFSDSDTPSENLSPRLLWNDWLETQLNIFMVTPRLQVKQWLMHVNCQSAVLQCPPFSAPLATDSAQLFLLKWIQPSSCQAFLDKIICWCVYVLAFLGFQVEQLLMPFSTVATELVRSSLLSGIKQVSDSKVASEAMSTLQCTSNGPIATELVGGASLVSWIENTLPSRMKW